MNILIINWRDLKNPLYGGAEIHITKIAEHLAKKHKVFFLTSGYKGAKDESINNVSYIHTGNELLFNYFVTFKIRDLVKEKKIDLIIEDINKVPFFTPLLVKIPVFVVVPHIFGKTIFKQTNFIFGTYVYLFEKPIRIVYKKSYFEVISNSTRDDLLKRGIDGKRIKVIECGIDKRFFGYDYQKKEYPQICYVGRLKKYKSVHHLIKAFKKVKEQCKECVLYIVGMGDYETELKKLVKRLRIEDVIFTGYVPEHEKIKILQESWISVYPSYIEGWGIVNIEANALGTPVISSNVLGLKDSVKDGFSGLLYEYGNIEQLAEKILTLLKNREKLKQMENDAKKWAKNFDWEKTNNLSEDFIEDFITEVVKSKTIDNK
ncbi:MAG: glycosyltransferase family 4 protein [candidate division WOR-3 bacterium]